MIKADDMSVESHLTHIDNAEDLPYLRGKLPDVSMRLFYRSNQYRTLVLSACNLIAWACVTKMEGYKLPHGMSGANVGVPWNIIAISRNRDNADRRNADIMINPRITGWYGGNVDAESNCGSIRLPKPIMVRRSASVEVRYCDYHGAECVKTFDRAHGALTIQHEVDHNLGILITDRAV